jgi:pyridoxal phosphate enzyme (YggS family)
MQNFPGIASMISRNRSSSIAENFQKVLGQIEHAARLAGRLPESVSLVVVTKGHPVDIVIQAILAGAKFLGENYPEEGVEKILALRDQIGVEWHMIGHVQSRKSRQVCEHYNWVHSVDSLKLAARMDRFAGELDIKLPVLLECNVSGEDTKFGFPAWIEDRWYKTASDIAPILKCKNIEVHGLMTIAPLVENPEEARSYFSRLRRLRDYLKERFPDTNWDELSMGMSSDFQVAVQEGATMVRIGQAILGPRPVR